MLARKASLNQLTQNSLASIPDGTMGYGLGLGSPTRSMSRGGDDGLRGRGRGTPVAGVDVDVGDQVNTPGGMHGTVKFIGTVKGKAGVFVGVELDPDMAGRGKNDGAVDGVRYFTTAHPNSGIFVPLARAQKRNSASSSNPPPTPTLLGLNSPTGTSALSPPSYPTPRRAESPFGYNNNNGARSGIGLAPSSRPSLPRPESPVRKTTPAPAARGLQPPGTPRNVSSAMGGRFGGPSQMPGKINYGRPRASSIASTVNGGPTHPERPGTATGFSGPTPRISHTPKHSGSSLGLKQPKNSGQSGLRSGSSMGMRSISSLGQHPERQQEDLQEETSQGDSGIGLIHAEESEYDNSNGGVSNGSTTALEDQLAQRDRQLQEQAAQLLEMEASFSELQTLIQSAQVQPPPVTSPISMRGGAFDDADATQLRALLREKTERIQVLTAEFDAHRADFRSTIDTLELASTETERVYEIKVQELMNEIRELQERTEDVESVARQLKQLEELVAELEEGLEDARRGEAEARGEVEFLRGEVERCREELRREKEKSAAAVANAAVGKLMRTGSIDSEVEKKDDEIRGLKAIIHSLSRDAVPAEDGSHAVHLGALRRVNGETGDGDELTMERNTREKLEREVNELQGLIDRKASREDELEKEIEFLRKRKETRASGASGSISEKTAPGIVGSWGRNSGERHRPSFSAADTETATATTASERESRGTVGSWRRARQSSASSMAGAEKEESVPEAVVSSGALAPITAEGSDAEAMWCEICETAGHDILTCTNMFGSAAGGPASAGPEGEKPLPTPPTIHAKEIVNDDDETKTIASDSDHIEPPLNINGNGNGNGVSPGSASFMEEEERRRIGAQERKKSVHLPAPPPMVSVDSSFGPVAGKESGVVEMDKWCAMCERDGHDSVDCPLEMDY
ncbi:hypothetical protein P167DRAFT_554631 [Morchella conica CCBAS932]|uniref:CAP-Gly domain-containing protein n=2 Tax=Morchella sect. Distantes TaxID=1051054 RepID=A0A3N4KP72_9PEZI|nr:hypothetical protein P167DRAFT_554631 [Morchella conica CCBAS932]